MIILIAIIFVVVVVAVVLIKLNLDIFVTKLQVFIPIKIAIIKQLIAQKIIGMPFVFIVTHKYWVRIITSNYCFNCDCF